MLDKIKNSWRNAAASVSVLKNNPGLLGMFALSYGLHLLFFAVLIAAVFGFRQLDDGGFNVGLNFTLSVWGVVKILLPLFLWIGSAILMTAALYHELLCAFNGGGVSLKRGLAAALVRWRELTIWAFFASTVGTMLKMTGMGNRLVMFGLGVSWSVCTLFAVPVLMREKNVRRPADVLRRSGLLIGNTWGEAVVGVMLFGGVGLAAAVVITFAGIMSGVYLGLAMNDWWMLLWCGGGAILFSAFLVMVLMALQTVYAASLYIFAVEGVVPGGFTREMLENGWRVGSDSTALRH